MNNQRIKLIRKCEWEEVFLSWYDNEGKNPHWNQLAKERNFASWADWRIKGYARRFECAEADWGLYEITNPTAIVLNWFGGPFRTWIEKCYAGQKTKSFAELASMPEIADNSKIITMVENYPKDSIITALELNDGRIFVIEGMHRACALAIMALSNKTFTDKLIFAIGKSNLSELPPVGQNKNIPKKIKNYGLPSEKN